MLPKLYDALPVGHIPAALVHQAYVLVQCGFLHCSLPQEKLQICKWIRLPVVEFCSTPNLHFPAISHQIANSWPGRKPKNNIQKASNFSCCGKRSIASECKISSITHFMTIGDEEILQMRNCHVPISKWCSQAENIGQVMQSKY